MKPVSILTLPLVYFLSACFSPATPGGLGCSETNSCPSGQSCINSTCTAGSLLPDASGAQMDTGVKIDASEGCLSDSQTFEYTGSIISFRVPDCVRSLSIEASGAQGGGGRNGLGGGKGAKIMGVFNVNGGETFSVLVGGEGKDATPPGTVLGQAIVSLQQGGGSGGGGSFVVDVQGNPLVVAGGGGGATHTGEIDLGVIDLEILIDGGVGQTGEMGQTGGGLITGMGGSNGAGGVTVPNAGGFQAGTAGGGLSGDGVGASEGDNTDFGTANRPGISFVSGGLGGMGGSLGRDGGFGGGGAAGFSGGGGGGYSGGGTGDIDGVLAAGGGGSFNSGANKDNLAGVRTGNGQIVISW